MIAILWPAADPIDMIPVPVDEEVVGEVKDYRGGVTDVSVEGPIVPGAGRVWLVALSG